MSTLMLEQGRRLTSLLVASLVAMAGAACAVLGARSRVAALAVALVPAALLLSTRPAASAILGVGLLPFAADVVRGGPVRVSVSDSLLMLAVLTAVLGGHRLGWRRITPLVPLLAGYTAVLLVVLAAALDRLSIINSFQRLQILLVPLLVGAVILERRQLLRGLDLYVVSASVLAVAWSVDAVPPGLDFQKNPVGQYIAGALIVVAADPGRRWRLPLVVPLGIGLLRTESRGALLGLVIGLVVLVAARPGADKLRTAAALVPFAAVLGLAYANLPDDVQQRTATFSDAPAASGGGGDYTINIRAAYRADATKIIDAHPFIGVGIGHYLSGNVSDDTLTNDPHNVLLLEAAEGGLPLASAFVFLVIGSGALLWRRRHLTPLASVALAVQTSVVGHGLVDVYWVRGTPVIGWLLVGAAIADAMRQPEADG